MTAGGPLGAATHADITAAIAAQHTADDAAYAAAQNVQVFDAGASTWTKPTDRVYRRVTIAGSGCGGPGGSGRKGAPGTVRCGGGGGAHGAQGVYEFAFDDVPATLSVSVASGPPGAAGVTANDTNGTTAAAGGSTIVTGTNLWLVFDAGFAGIGGSSTSGAGGAAMTASMFQARAGSSASASGGGGTAAVSGTGASGAAGGGIPITDTFSIGQVGIGSRHLQVSPNPPGGATDGASGADAPSTNIPASLIPPGGRCGGSGASSVLGNAGNAGASSGYGAGGSGGGAATNGVGNSGAGAAGMPGRVVIICY